MIPARARSTSGASRLGNQYITAGSESELQPTMWRRVCQQNRTIPIPTQKTTADDANMKLSLKSISARVDLGSSSSNPLKISANLGIM